MRRAFEAIVLAGLCAAPVPTWAASTADLPDPALSRALDAIVIPVDAESREFFGIPESETGALVLAVAQGGTAEVYGIKPGDIVVEVSGLRFALPDEIDAIVWAFMKDRKYSFDWKIARDGSVSAMSFPLVETHFQESYLVSDIPGWPGWSEWSRRSSQGWSGYASAHLDDFSANFEGPPVCRSCAAPSAAVSETVETPPPTADVTTAPSVAAETSPADAEPPSAAATPPADEPAESVATPTVDPVAAGLAPGMLVTPVPDQPVLFNRPATVDDVGDRASVPPAEEVEEAPPATAAAIEDAAPTTTATTPVAASPPLAAIDSDPARIPRPAPERPAFAAVGEPPEVNTISGAPGPAAPQVTLPPPPEAAPPEADMAIGVIAPDVQTPPVDSSVLNAAPAEANFGVAEPDFCARYPATCRMRELGYGDGRGDRSSSGNPGGGGGDGGGDGGEG